MSAPDRIDAVSAAAGGITTDDGDAVYQSLGAGCDVDENLPHAAIAPSSIIVSRNRRVGIMHEGT